MDEALPIKNEFLAFDNVLMRERSKSLIGGRRRSSISWLEYNKDEFANRGTKTNRNLWKSHHSIKILAPVLQSFNRNLEEEKYRLLAEAECYASNGATVKEVRMNVPPLQILCDGRIELVQMLPLQDFDQCYTCSFSRLNATR